MPGAKCRRNLKGHLGKVTCVHFGSQDNRTLVSGSLDSKLILWDTWTNNKIRIIPLQSSWTMTCCLSPQAELVASGGMDNLCTIHDASSARIVRELLGFQGYLSCVCFLDEGKLLTSSADGNIFLWDVESGYKISEFTGHANDVLCVSLAAGDNNSFVSGSVDNTAKVRGIANWCTMTNRPFDQLWDIRSETCRQTFWGHDGDVNSVHVSLVCLI